MTGPSSVALAAALALSSLTLAAGPAPPSGPSAPASALEAAVADAGGTPALAAALTEDAKLTDAAGAGGDQFGFAVAVSGDRAFVGAPYGDTGATDAGAVHVYTFDGAAWAPTATLTAADAAPGHLFGYSIALSGDRALIGSIGTDDGGSASGSAYVFAFDGAAWAQEAKLTASDADAGDQFGLSVALSGDRALIGAPQDDAGAVDAGSAYVFAFDGTAWAEEAKLTSPDPFFRDGFGFTVALSGDRALVGAPSDNVFDDFETSEGAVYAFAFDGTAWTGTQKFRASDAATADGFGVAIALSGDRALIGAPSISTPRPSEDGSAYVFTFDGAAWTETQTLGPSDAPLGGLSFGVSVALSGDRALVGARGDGDGGTEAGAAYTFAFDGAGWAEEAKLTASDASSADRLGWSVALSGGRALAGAPFDHLGEGGALPSAREGSAYAFAFNAPPVADAGPDQTVVAGQTAALDGSASSDPDGDALAFAWALAGPGSPALSDAAAVAASFCAVEAGAYTATLVVDDGAAVSAPDAAVVTAVAPTDAVAGLSDAVAALEADGTLSPLRAGALRVTLAIAAWWLDRGDDARADRALGWFVRGVDLLAARGHLDAATADSLAADADAIAEALTAPCGAPTAAATAQAASAPGAFGLAAPYPNPTSGAATVRFKVPDRAEVRVAVFDALGREVAVLAAGPVEAGAHAARLDAGALPAGRYVVRLSHGARVSTRPLTVVR